MKPFLLSAVVGAMAIVVLTMATRQYFVGQKSVAILSQGPTVERLERLAHLVTTRIYIADVLVGEGEGCRGACAPAFWFRCLELRNDCASFYSLPLRSSRHDTCASFDRVYLGLFFRHLDRKP